MEGLKLGHTLHSSHGLNLVVPVPTSSLVSRPSFPIQPKCNLVLSTGNFFRDLFFFPSSFGLVVVKMWGKNRKIENLESFSFSYFGN